MSDLGPLNRELHGEAPDDFSALSQTEIQFLTDGLRTTCKRQQSQIQQAMESALGHIPLLLRGPVRKILIG